MPELASEDEFTSAVEQVDKNTLTHLYPLWMQNVVENIRMARNGDSLDQIFSRPPVERVLVVGRGPSLKKHNHIELLANSPYSGAIVASDGALPLLAEKGIAPSFSLTVDGSPIITKWYADEQINRIASKFSAILPITVHQDVVSACNKAGLHIYWYIPELDHAPTKIGVTETLQLLTLSVKNPTGLSRMNGAGNCGLASMVFSATILRAKEIVLIGMDGGYLPDTPLSECHYHNALLKACSFNELQTAKLYKILWIPNWEQYCIIDPIFEIYRRIYLGLARQIKNTGIRIVNCTEGGCLVSDETECMKFEDYLGGLKI